MKDKDDNVVTFETFASRKKEQLLSDDENFNDSIIEFIQMHIRNFINNIRIINRRTVN